MIAITGGGTGGHLVIARAIKEELNKRGMKPIYIGSTNGQDQSWFESDEGFEKTYFLQSQGVVNKKGFKKILSLFAIIQSAFTCKAIFKEHHITKVFSVGGYSAAPASIGAIIANIPLYIHEQNAIKGKLNTLLKPFSKAFFSSYEKDSPLQNYPVSEVFFDIQRQRESLKTIIFLGGSQGASPINALALKMALELKIQGINIIHQTGKKEFEMVKKFYEEHDIKADVFDFTTNIAPKLQNADFAISRSGASTLWELCAACVPSLFIPYPHAAANHQFFNAQALAQNGLALIENQNTLDAQNILEKIQRVNIKEISHNLAPSIHHGGAKEIVDYILKKD